MGTNTERGWAAVYQWLTPGDFLIHRLLPDALSLQAGVEDDPAVVLDSVPDSVRLFVFHLNITRSRNFPTRRSELVAGLDARGVGIINRAATDISKSEVQRVCTRLGLNSTATDRQGPDNERIIIKTDLNFGGDSEWALSEKQRDRVGAGQGSGVMWKPNDYLVLPRSEVPDELWSDPTLVHERFVSNRDNRWYRSFVFRGRVAICELVSPSDVKKVWESSTSNIWKVEMNGEEPAALTSRRAARLLRDLRTFVPAFGLDFGAVDFVMDDDDEPYLIDVNTTPAYSYPFPGLAEFLREGLG